MANVMTDQILGTLLGQRRSPVRDAADEELLDAPPIRGSLPEALGLAAPPPPAPAPEPDLPPAQEPQVSVGPGTMSEPARVEPSRVDRLLSTLQRPGRGDHAAAAFFDSLFGGDNYTSDVRARRNQFDQALMGAQAADVASTERMAEAGAGREMQREQMALTQRAQDLASDRAEETRRFQEAMLAQRQGFTAGENAKNRDAQMARAKLGPHHKGAGGPATPEARAEAENARLSMEAAHLVRVANAPGRPAPYTQAQALSYLKGEETGLAPEVLAQLELERSTLAGMRAQNPTKYADMIASASKAEASSTEGLGGNAEKQLQNKKERLKLKTELSDMKADVTAAISGWNSMSPTAKQTFVQFAGGGGNLAQTLKDIKLSPEDKAHGAAIQSLANVLIKARSGSAVTGSEWQRVAQEIGLPVGDWSIFNSTSVLASWLQKAKAGHDRRRANVLSEYPNLFKEAADAEP